MLVTKELIRDQLLAYLNHRITLAQLVDWAENTLCDGELEMHDIETLSDILARLGLADVREFGLSWEDCSTFLARLGYQLQVEAIPMAA
jgi:hypothetical protein